MFFFVSGIDQNIINEDNDKFVELQHENKVHEVHEMSWCIGKTKGHDYIFIKTISSSESSLRNVLRMDFYLVVARSEIDLRKHFGSSKLIKE
jgi:hypothetical protein